MNREDVLRKVRGLLRLAESEQNLKTAENIAAKATELLTKYKLDMSEVDLEHQNEIDPFGTIIISPQEWGGFSLPKRIEWTEDLADVIARANFCRALIFQDSNKIAFTGRKSDVDIARYIFTTTLRTALRVCEVELAEVRLKFLEDSEKPTQPPRPYDSPFDLFRGLSLQDIVNSDFRRGFQMPQEPKNIEGDDFRYNFFVGFNHTLKRRFDNQRRELESNSTALVRVDKEVDNYIQTLELSDLPREEKNRQVSRIAQEKGISYGYTVDLKANALYEEQEKQELTNGDE
jgi:hypothetical protein